MTDDVPPRGDEAPERAWLLEPLGPHEVRVYVEAGEGVEISPEAREALEALLIQLQGTEVEAFVESCPDLSSCGNYTCHLDSCWPQGRYPCRWNETCKINPVRMW